jgi:AraC-like DNA-binding protein
MAAGNMFERIKSMIAECMKKRAADACGDCAMKGVCNHKWTKPQGKSVNGWPRPAASSADNPLLGLFDAFAKAIVQKPVDPNSLRRRVEGKLEPMLESGEVSLDKLASELGMSRATLQRRLKAEGTTFEAILDGLRQRLARRYLRKDKHSVKTTAYLLGFSDPAAFSRAFKRWTGTSPSELRSTA